jgi:hypothetical protein
VREWWRKQDKVSWAIMLGLAFAVIAIAFYPVLMGC